MVMAITAPELTLRSLDADWDRGRWARLPADGNRYEIVDGVLYVSTVPSNAHQLIIRQAFLALYPQIDQPGWGVTLFSPIGLFMPGCDPVQPDLLILRAEDADLLHDQHIRGIPALVVEVLSPSNADQDLVIKRAAYARAGVPEYWVMRPAERDVLVHSQPDPASGLYLQVGRGAPDGELISPTLPFRVPATAFFAGIPNTAR